MNRQFPDDSIRMDFIENGYDDSLTISWKESRMNLSLFVERNRPVIDAAREKFYVDTVVDR